MDQMYYSTTYYPQTGYQPQFWVSALAAVIVMYIIFAMVAEGFRSVKGALF